MGNIRAQYRSSRSSIGSATNAIEYESTHSRLSDALYQGASQPSAPRLKAAHGTESDRLPFPNRRVYGRYIANHFRVPGWGLEQHRDISINGQRQDCSSQLNNIPATHECKRIQQHCTGPSSRCPIPNFEFFNTRKQPHILLWK